MKKIIGLDLGTNSIGWALVEQDFDNKKGEILDLGNSDYSEGCCTNGKF
jgi:CRISPR-associated endonuclease Csn1